MEESKDIRLENEPTGDPDQLRGNTMNEAIREVNGDPDMNLNALKTTDQSTTEYASGSGSYLQDSDQTQGISYNPNDASGVSSGGFTDMDDQTAGGAGLNTSATQGLGSNLTTKTAVTGSDFDGQDSTS